jgi:protein-S-isoprenylcysteine O-methyltransferase Ste14
MVSIDSLRSSSATFLLALCLPVPFYMLSVHALGRLWKRMGRASYAVLWTFYALCVAAIVIAHGLWGWKAWSWPVWISWTGLLPLALAAGLAYWTYRTIPARTLLAFRQIESDGERPLVRDGVLGVVRHPRYVMFVLVALANFLITGYPLVLASLVVAVAVFAVVMRLEEGELRSHFGGEFERYRREVPAFFPRPTRRLRR